MRRYRPKFQRTGLMLVLAVVGLVVVLQGLWNRVECAWYGHETNRETRYSMFLGCLVETPNGDIPRGELRVVQ